MAATTGQVRLIRERIEGARRALDEVAACGSEDVAHTRLDDVTDAQQWFTQKTAARAEYARCLREAAEVESEARATVAQTEEALQRFRQGPQPLPGSAEFEALAAQVRAVEAPAVEARAVLADLATAPIEPVAEFLAQVDQGARQAAAVLVHRAAQRTCRTIAERMGGVVHLIKRDVLAPLDAYDETVALARRYAGHDVPVPFLAVPHCDAWKAASAGAPPEVVPADSSERHVGRGTRERRAV